MVCWFAPNGHRSRLKTREFWNTVDFRSTSAIIGNVTDSRTTTWLDCTITPKPKRIFVMSPMQKWPPGLWSLNNGSEPPAE